MSYAVHITATAELDLEKAYDHIDNIFKNHQAAESLLDEASKQIGALATMPEKFALVDDPILKSWGIRFTMIKNYHAFYTVSKEKEQVTVLRILYAKRNWIYILKKSSAIV